MEKPTKSETALAWYADHELVRALLQLFPAGIGGAVDVLITGKVDAIRKERTAVFFEALSNNQIQLSNDVIGSEEFLHKYFITANAARNTRRREKIVLFANLLANGDRCLVRCGCL
ncbi:hypothetical protein [Luteolibacter soli]|uniref:Uncharacterized protein n=1 Tax=Luteolibacter soli TaxID=3135280 RepID=A0ABU9B1U0_9BACT